MAIITSLAFQKNQKRVNIFLDNEFAFGLATIVVLRHHLKKNQTLLPSKIVKLFKESIIEECLEGSKNLIVIRRRSEREIKIYLKKKLIKIKNKKSSIFFKKQFGSANFISNLIEETIDKLKQKHFIDDRKFAQWFIKQRIIFKPRSRQFIKYELLQKGIDGQITRNLFEEGVFTKNQEKTSAKKLGKKYFKKLTRSKTTSIKAKNIGKKQIRIKMYRYLGNYGFSFGLTKEVVDDLLKTK